ncbi:MAG TPA: ACT domain-containing protein [Thermoanaerobaculaceae bacterium]|nr:ACT domain-containing protein [Thermoanaerobaculaceae bacterium]HPS76962.1 ACT domain-containing protein [Thermoanaerobaculaceae bacterium]
MPSLRFCVLDPELAVVRLEEGDGLPGWATRGDLWGVIRAPGELTVVCETSQVPAGARAETGWMAFRLQGPFPFDSVGVLAAVAAPLAAAGVSIFALSTFDTDIVLVKRTQIETAVLALQGAGLTLFG